MEAKDLMIGDCVNTIISKEIKYRSDGVECYDKCPHTGRMIGSGACFCCEWYDHQQEQHLKVYCNHPKWVT